MEVIPFNNADSFWLKDNAIFHHLELLKKWIILHNLSYVLKHKQDIFFSFFSIQIIKSNCYIVFPNFFQSSFSDEKFIPSQLYLFIKSLIFVILCGSFFISSGFNPTVTMYWKNLLSFLLKRFIVAFFIFIQLGESMLEPPWFGFILRIYNTIIEHIQRQIQYLSSIPNYFHIYFYVNQKVLL